MTPKARRGFEGTTGVTRDAHLKMCRGLKGMAAQLGAVGIQKAAFDIVEKMESSSGTVTEEITRLITKFNRFLGQAAFHRCVWLV